MDKQLARYQTGSPAITTYAGTARNTIRRGGVTGYGSGRTGTAP
ncbi:MAG TPA: hypothetical protein VF477_01495 [Mycobacterium sp.]